MAYGGYDLRDTAYSGPKILKAEKLKKQSTKSLLKKAMEKKIKMPTR